MKHTKRFFAVLLAVVLLLGVVPVMNVGITASAVSINDLKAQYPAGKYWNGGDASTCTSSPCTHHNGNCPYSGSCGCNTFKGHAIQCMGFAYQLASLVYGGDPYVERTANQSTSALDSLKAGDIITYKNGGHTIFVTGVEGDTITFADCNSDYQCGIRWDETISKSKVRSTFKYVDPAPYEWTNGSSAPTLFGTESLDLGTGFYAKIRNRAANKYITNVETGSSDNSLIGKANEESLNQIWRFDLV
ncbi:MAG: hypothetical protein IJL52_10790, partial [Clostridia bacterium]|nr:hypothetical protein [Clostridia bacterium]